MKVTILNWAISQLSALLTALHQLRDMGGPKTLAWDAGAGAHGVLQRQMGRKAWSAAHTLLPEPQGQHPQLHSGGNLPFGTLWDIPLGLSLKDKKAAELSQQRAL